MWLCGSWLQGTTCQVEIYFSVLLRENTVHLLGFKVMLLRKCVITESSLLEKKDEGFLFTDTFNCSVLQASIRQSAFLPISSTP